MDWRVRGRAESGGRRNTRQRSGRAFRGLFLVFALSFINLIGIIFTLTALGGLAPWSRSQFIGAFGLLEIAAGLANVITPNIWRLPIAELQTGRTEIKLAGSALLLPHWGALARCAAGLVLVAFAAWQEGLGPPSVALVPLVLFLAWWIVGISAVLARVAIARADIDVVQVVVRWRGRVREITPISLSAAFFQFVLSIVTVPAAKLLRPSVLYQPELAPSLVTLLATFGGAIALVALVYVLWSGRIAFTAPSAQQREAEEHA
jgi:hypothetical protein